MKVFIDTSAFIALFVSSEYYHKRIKDKYNFYRKQRALFYTSYYILDELYTRLIYDFGHDVTKKVIDLLSKSLEKEEIKILDIDEGTFKESLAALLKFSEHSISLTDATTCMLYKDLGLDEVFTLDSDFKKIGVKASF